MGARLYLPSLGRFLSVDSVEGGTDNAYSYVNDPVNDFDLEGTFGFKKFFKSVAKTVTTVATVASFIPGPIGMVASGVAVVGNAAQGNWKGAALAASGLVGGGAIGKLASNTKAMKGLMSIQAKMPLIGAKSVFFGKTGHTIIFGKKLPTFGNGILPKLTNGKLRIGWTASNHKLTFAIRSGARHAKFKYSLPSNVNKNWRW